MIDCKLKLFKEKVKTFWNQYKPLIIFVFIIWCLFTGFFWISAEKTTYQNICTTRTAGYIGYDTNWNVTYTTRNYEHCIPFPETGRYTLVETIGLEGKIIQDFFGWITSYRVI